MLPLVGERLLLQLRAHLHRRRPAPLRAHQRQQQVPGQAAPQRYYTASSHGWQPQYFKIVRSIAAHPTSVTLAASSFLFTNLPRPCVNFSALYSRRSFRVQYCLHSRARESRQRSWIKHLRQSRPGRS